MTCRGAEVGFCGLDDLAMVRRDNRAVRWLSRGHQRFRRSLALKARLLAMTGSRCTRQTAGKRAANDAAATRGLRPALGRRRSTAAERRTSQTFRCSGGRLRWRCASIIYRDRQSAEDAALRWRRAPSPGNLPRPLDLGAMIETPRACWKASATPLSQIGVPSGCIGDQACIWRPSPHGAAQAGRPRPSRAALG